MGQIYHANGIFLYQMEESLLSTDVAIVAHGAWFRKDKPSMCTIPPSTTVKFYSQHLQFTIGAERDLKNGDFGFLGPPVQTSGPSTQMHNYRLSCDGRWKQNRHTGNFPQAVEQGYRGKNRWMDLIMIEDVSEDFYVHVWDVFKFLHDKAKHYNNVHFAACRVQWSYKNEGWK